MSSHRHAMSRLPELFENNRRWAARMVRAEPEFFDKLVGQQAPRYMWIGCADSRVPANEIVGLLPGEMFVHRNVANLVVHTDLNCLSALQFAIDVLHVQHVIVCGHYGCGGIAAARRGAPLGLIDNWLRHIQDTQERHRTELDALVSETGAEARALDRLCEVEVGHLADVLGHDAVAGVHGVPLQFHGLLQGVAKPLDLDDFPERNFWFRFLFGSCFVFFCRRFVSCCRRLLSLLCRIGLLGFLRQSRLHADHDDEDADDHHAAQKP